MSDLFSPLRDPEQLPTPPASEVRRRGDALRRRRRALQAGGVAVAVTAVALVAVGLTGGAADRSSEPPPAGSPSATPTTPTSPVGRLTTIPSSLDLVRDWADADGAGEEEKLASGPDVQWLGDIVECEASHSPRDEQVDHLGVLYEMPGSTQARDLRVFRDDATAQRVAEDYVSGFRECPSFSIDGAASETHNAVGPLGLGDQSWLVSQTYWTDGTPQLAENALVVTRVANTVLVTRRYGEYPGATDETATRQMHAGYVDEVRPVVAELSCTFGGC